MNIKYFYALSYSHWMKVSLPLVLALFVFFASGIIKGQVETFFKKNTKNVSEMFAVSLGQENNEFAKALSKIDKLEPRQPADFRRYLNANFFLRQKNDIVVLMEIQRSKAEKGQVAAEVLPPAPVYDISSIFIGKSRKFAIINGNIVKVGERMPSGEFLADVENGRVLMNGRWGNRWLFVNY